MKKILATLVLLALVMPAAAVDVTVVPSATETCAFDIMINTTGAEVVRGVAVTVSLDAATVGDATNGENGAVVAVNSAMNCYMDYASTTPATYALGDGHPLADLSAAGEPTFPASDFSVCLGVLDETGNQGGLNTGGTAEVLCTIVVSGSTTVTIAEDTYRGGIVGDDIDTVSASSSCSVVCGPGPCITESDPVYANWVKAGEPEAWCWRFGCKGDANNDFSGKDKAGARVWVDSSDLTIFLAGWQKKDNDANMADWIAADCNMDFSGKDKTGGRVWVDSSDLTIFLAGWQKKDNDPIFSTDCPYYVAE